MADEVEVKIEQDVDPLCDTMGQFLGDDDNSYSQAALTYDEGQNNDEDGDSAFCIIPSITKKRSRGRPKKTTEEKVKPRGYDTPKYFSRFIPAKFFRFTFC